MIEAARRVRVAIRPKFAMPPEPLAQRVDRAMARVWLHVQGIRHPVAAYRSRFAARGRV